MSVAPEERVRFPVVRQRWRSLTFLHVRYPPDIVARSLPAGLEPDTWDGSAWLGITPFRMSSSVLPFVPGPQLPVGETNVRTYVRDRDGRDAIWFLTLDLANPVVAAALRAGVRLPYRWADVTVERDGPRARYRTRRRRPHRPGRLELEVEAGEAVPSLPGSLETWLTGRWRAYTRILGRTLSVPVQHEPWPLRAARLVRWEGDLLETVGLPPPDDEPHLLFSPGVDVRIGWPRSA